MSSSGGVGTAEQLGVESRIVSAVTAVAARLPAARRVAPRVLRAARSLARRARGEEGARSGLPLAVRGSSATAWTPDARRQPRARRRAVRRRRRSGVGVVTNRCSRSSDATARTRRPGGGEPRSTRSRSMRRPKSFAKRLGARRSRRAPSACRRARSPVCSGVDAGAGGEVRGCVRRSPSSRSARGRRARRRRLGASGDGSSAKRPPGIGTPIACGPALGEVRRQVAPSGRSPRSARTSRRARSRARGRAAAKRRTRVGVEPAAGLGDVAQRRQVEPSAKPARVEQVERVRARRRTRSRRRGEVGPRSTRRRPRRR